MDSKFYTPSASFLNYSHKASNEDSLISSRYSITHSTEGRIITGLSIILCLTLGVFSLIYSSDLSKAVQRASLRDVSAHSCSKNCLVYSSLFFAFLILSASFCEIKQCECSSSISSLILLIFARVLTAADAQSEVEFEKGSCLVGCELIISHIQVSNPLFIDNITQSQIMKRDYQDIRMSERINYGSSLINFSSVASKVESFTSPRTPNMRERDNNELLHPDNILSLQFCKAPSSLAKLSEDPSKNLSSRLKLLNSAALCDLGLSLAHSQRDKIDNQVKRIILKSLERFKNEHEDEQSMYLDITRVDRERERDVDLQQAKQILSELLSKMDEFVTREEATQGEGEEHQSDKQLLLALQIFRKLQIPNINNGDFLRLVYDIDKIQSQILPCMECRRGSVVINYWPELESLSLVLHPLLLALYSCINKQIKTLEKRSLNKEISQSDDPKVIEIKPMDTSKMVVQTIFKDIYGHNCSKVTFINLDGYDSPLNLTIAKCLNKHIQYVSFPIDPSGNLSKHHIFQQTTELWNQTNQVFKVNDNPRKELLEYYRNLFVFSLNYPQGLKEQQNDITPYYSKFIAFILKELVYSQIRDFSPSLIVVSHSGRLNIESHHFESIFKELSVLSNIKVMLYNNFPCEVREPKLKYFQREDERDAPEAREWSRTGMNNETLHNISIFLKTTSGTQSLDKDQVQIQKEQNFQTFKILPYASNILQIISKNHPVLNKIQNRFKQYKKRSKLLETVFRSTSEDLQSLPLYYKLLLASLREIIQNGQINSNESFIQENRHIIAYIIDNYGRTKEEREEHLNNFFLKCTIRIKGQQDKETTKYFVRLPLQDSMERSRIYDIIALQFELQTHRGRPLFRNPNSEVLISKTRRPDLSVIYLLNHLPDANHRTLCNYAGILTNDIQESNEGRVILKEVIFRQRQYQMAPHHHFCQFNYMETGKYVILFWPFLYDKKADFLHSYANVKYEPRLTDLIFVARRANPFEPSHVVPTNLIRPRSACTCFQVQNSDKIFVFGGFYGGLSNYTQFQTEITEFTLTQQELALKNIPKSFYLDSQVSNTGKSLITKIHNDFVRPRMQFEIYPKRKIDNILEILLVGGIGQKYIRPYSILSHKGHLITFLHDSIQSVKRIKLNNLIVSNLTHPTRTVTKSCNLMIRSAQNRRLITIMNKTAQNHSLTFSHYHLKYEQIDFKMKCEKIYEVVVREEEEKDGEWTGIRELQKMQIALHSFMGVNQPKISIFFDYHGTIHLKLMFELDEERALEFPNQSSKQKLIPLIPGQNILSVDTYSGQVYALIQHRLFTFGRPVLVRSDPYTMQQMMTLTNKPLSLKEIYNFDKLFQRHTINVLQDEKITILHGYHFYEQIHSQIFLTKDKAGFFYSQLVQPSPNSQIMMAARLNLPSYNSCPKTSFLLSYQHQILCFSFLQVNNKGGNNQKVLLLVEELTIQSNLNRQLQWKIISEHCLELHFQVIEEMNMVLEKRIVDLSFRVERHETNQRLVFQLHSCCSGTIFQGAFYLDTLSQGAVLTMRHAQNEINLGLEEYRNKRINSSKNIHYAKFIDKTLDPSTAGQIDVESI